MNSALKSLKIVKSSVNNTSVKVNSKMEIEKFTSSLASYSECMQTSLDRPVNMFPVTNLEWNLHAIRKSTLTPGYHGCTYIIRIEEKNYFNKYNIGPNYYTVSTSTCRHLNWLSVRGKDTPYESTIVYVGENRMVGFSAEQNRAYFDECEDKAAKQKECLLDPVVYNAHETCVNVECARVVDYLMHNTRNRVHVVSINYPFITFSLACTSMQDSYKVDEADAEMTSIIDDICKYITNVRVQDKYAVMFAYPQHDAYITCRTLNSFRTFPHEEVRVSEAANVYAPDVYTFLSFSRMPLCTRVKLSMYKSPEYMDMSSVSNERYKFVHECFSTKSSHVYAFFDIDINNVNIADWSDQVCTVELAKLHRELCTLFRVDTFDFSVSRAFRDNKISFHLISNCILVSDLYEFKNDLCLHKFTSVLGQNIDTCVYKNNGSLRMATKYKEASDKKDKCDVTSSRLDIITNDNMYNHMITKMPVSSARFVTSQASEYFKSLNENVQLDDTLDYRTVIEPSRLKSIECKLNLVDQLIDVYFTYDKCFSDMTRMYKFVSCVVACVNSANGGVTMKRVTNESSNVESNTIDYYMSTNASNGLSSMYEQRLLARVDNSESKKKDHKMRIIRRLFRAKQCKPHIHYNYYIDRLAAVHKCTLAKDIDMTLELNIRTCTINTQYLSSEDLNIDRFVHSRFERLFVKSTMGTGKTEALFRFLVDRPTYIRVLILCSRRSMVEEMKKRMCDNGLDYLANSSDENFTREILLKPDCGVIISTCESLYKLGMYIDEFQLIVCDEMEAIIDQMSSGETHRSRLNENNYQLSMYLRTAKLLAMDGQLTENAIRMHQIPNRSIYLINKFEPKKNISRAHDREEFLQIMAVMYKDGKNLAVATDTRIACITIYEMLSGKQYDPKSIDSDFIVYNSDTSASIDITSIDMHRKTILYTPSMDVSVSITAHIPDMIFGYFTNSQISAYCKAQMLMRFRHTENILVYESTNNNRLSNDAKIKNLLFDVEHERVMDLCARKETKVCNTLKNLDGMKKFKFNNLTKIYNRFVSKSMNQQASVHQYSVHKTFKRLSNINDLIKIQRRPAYSNTNDDDIKEEKPYSKIYTEIYNINSYKYSFGIHIESVLSEVVTMMESPADTFKYQTPFEKKTISACVYVVMEKYQWLNLNKYSSQEVQVKGALSIIYHLSSYYDEHQYTSLDDFRRRFLGREHVIRLFVALVRARNRQCQMFLILMLRSMFVYNGAYFIDMACLQHQASTIALKYFREIGKSRVKYYLRKYLPSVKIMDANPNPDEYEYVDIFASAEQYNNFELFTKNVCTPQQLAANVSNECEMINDNIEYNINAINDDLLVSTSHTATYLSKFIHRISLDDLARVELEYAQPIRTRGNDADASLENDIRRQSHIQFAERLVNETTLTGLGGNKERGENKTNTIDTILMNSSRQRRKEVNLQFIILARNANKLVCINFAREAYKNSSVHPNVYTSTLYEYDGIHTKVFLHMLDTRDYIVMKPIEYDNEKGFITKETIVKFIDTSIKYDLDIKKMDWRSKSYKMYENKAISILGAIDTNISRLVDDHLREHEATCSRVYKRHGYEPLVVYDPKKKREKKKTSMSTIFDVDDIVTSIALIETGSQGIVSEYRARQLDEKQKLDGTARFLRWEENPDCNAVECTCIYCMPNLVYTPSTDPFKNAINLNEYMIEKNKHLLQCMSVYREIICDYLIGFGDKLTIKEHTEFVSRDTYIRTQMNRVVNDPTCYAISNEYVSIAI
jgi:hypothetical protein